MSLLAPIPIKHQPANFRASDYGAEAILEGKKSPTFFNNTKRTKTLW